MFGGGGQQPTKRTAKMVGSFDQYDYHSLDDLKTGIAKLKSEEREKVTAVLLEKNLWGQAVSGQSVMQAVRDKLGDDMAKKVQRQVLTRYKVSGLTPKQMQRNINLIRYQRGLEDAGKDQDQGSGFANEPGRGHSVGINAPKSGEMDKATGFASKRPISF